MTPRHPWGADNGLGGMDTTEKRKREHLQPFREGKSRDVGSAWFEHVHLVHQALPEMAVDDVDLTTTFCGRVFCAPVFITGMTGGTEEARDINRGLARVAFRMGLAFGVGSQRAMIENPALAETYRVRGVAPDVFLAGNIGAVQLARLPLARVREALDLIEADALCVHLNPAQEMAQPEGERDFRGLLDAIAEAVAGLGRPVIVKEVGCGLSREVARTLWGVGVRQVDVAGVGGTSFIRVEAERAGLGEDPQWVAFDGWGIPTAASLTEVAGLGLEVIASGGVRGGLDAAKAMALGARMVGVASPVIRAWFQGGEGLVERYLSRLLDGLKTAMVLTGCRTLQDLSRAPRVLSGPLAEWARARAEQDLP